jgi:hypothetical protein
LQKYFLKNMLPANFLLKIIFEGSVKKYLFFPCVEIFAVFQPRHKPIMKPTAKPSKGGSGLAPSLAVKLSSIGFNWTSSAIICCIVAGEIMPAIMANNTRITATFKPLLTWLCDLHNRRHNGSPTR